MIPPWPFCVLEPTLPQYSTPQGPFWAVVGVPGNSVAFAQSNIISLEDTHPIDCSEPILGSGVRLPVRIVRHLHAHPDITVRSENILQLPNGCD